MKRQYHYLPTLLAAASFAIVAIGARADDAAALTTEIQRMDATAGAKGQGVVSGKIVSDFETWAGSRTNATSLVTGLRSGTEVTLTAQGQPMATFTPPTRPMGYGNISISLALARYQLAQQGITNPTPAQLQTAMMGGTITANGKTVDYQGILQMRADGTGWGEIAHALGTKLGPVVSGIKSQNQHFASLPNAASKPGHVGTARDGSASSGVATAAGGVQGNGQARGHAGKGTTAAVGMPRGQGIVTAAGHSASPAAYGAGGAKGSAPVTAGGNAAGSAASAQGGGNGRAVGHTK